MAMEGERRRTQSVYRSVCRRADSSDLTNLPQVVFGSLVPGYGVLLNHSQSREGLVTVLTLRGVSQVVIPTLGRGGSIWPQIDVHRVPVSDVYLLDAPSPVMTRALAAVERYLATADPAAVRPETEAALRDLDLAWPGRQTPLPAGHRLASHELKRAQPSRWRGALGLG